MYIFKNKIAPSGNNLTGQDLQGMNVESGKYPGRKI